MSPHGLAIDGARIWIANTGNNRVSESRLSDGEMIATMPVGVSPQGIVFNGTHIWVTNNGSNTVSRIQPRLTSLSPVPGFDLDAPT